MTATLAPAIVRRPEGTPRRFARLLEFFLPRAGARRPSEPGSFAAATIGAAADPLLVAEWLRAEESLARRAEERC